jgi:ABC-type dipeptide/oligopeptide/nickel transport system permease component
MMEAGILTVGAAYILSAIVADMLIGLLDPRTQAAQR